ncbi:MAG: glycosyltransferase family 2 protein [bacterium]|nr:glycosyltransferase family 2 protein [bacterium]
MVSVIIPAYNEEETIGGVVSSAIAHPSFTEIIVVDDGSDDETAIRAEKMGARVIRLPQNVGKAVAMSKGVQEAKNDIILFLDADIWGYDHAQLSMIIDPVINGKYEMFVGIRERKIFLFNKYAHFFPIISGERAMTRSLWEKIPKKYKKGFEIEIASNYIAKRTKKGMGFMLLSGIHHATKEKKYGLFEGLWRRMCMIGEILKISTRLYILSPLLRK